MSSSSCVPEPLSLSEEILLLVAQRLGPQIDQVQITEVPAMKVTDIVLEFRREQGQTPVEIRAAIMTCIRKGWLAERLSSHEKSSFELMPEETEILLRSAGLLAARKVNPDIGRSKVAVTIYLNPEKEGCALDAQLDTGREKVDARLNQSGVAAQALYLLIAFRPSSETPLWIGSPQVKKALEHLGAHGVHPKRGKGIRISSSTDALAEALETWTQVLPNLQKSKGRSDARRAEWWFEDGLPEFEFDAHPDALVQTWRDFRYAIWSVAINSWNPFLPR